MKFFLDFMNFERIINFFKFEELSAFKATTSFAFVTTTRASNTKSFSFFFFSLVFHRLQEGNQQFEGLPQLLEKQDHFSISNLQKCPNSENRAENLSNSFWGLRPDQIHCESNCQLLLWCACSNLAVRLVICVCFWFGIATNHACIRAK